MHTYSIFIASYHLGLSPENSGIYELYYLIISSHFSWLTTPADSSATTYQINHFTFLCQLSFLFKLCFRFCIYYINADCACSACYWQLLTDARQQKFQPHVFQSKHMRLFWVALKYSSRLQYLPE